MENWKPVKEYPHRFMISDHGRFKSVKYDRILSQNLNSGYYCHCTRIDGKCLNLRIHRLVAEAFLPEPSEELKAWAKTTVYGVVQVNHKDGNKLNNKVENLEWCDGSYNKKHAIETGLYDPKSLIQKDLRKLSDEDVRFIKENYIPRDKMYGSLALAERFDVNHRRIYEIMNGYSYKEVK